MTLPDADKDEAFLVFAARGFRWGLPTSRVSLIVPEKNWKAGAPPDLRALLDALGPAEEEPVRRVLVLHTGLGLRPVRLSGALQLVTPPPGAALPLPPGLRLSGRGLYLAGLVLDAEPLMLLNVAALPLSAAGVP